MCSAVKFTALCALLMTYLSTIHCQVIKHNQSEPQCAHSPTIRILSIDYDALQDCHISANNNKATITYGSQTSLKITCFDEDVKALVMTKDGVKLLTTIERDAIVWRTGKQYLQQSEYVCRNTETNCQFSAIVAVIPACSRMIRNSEYFKHGNIIKYGNSISFSCYGSPASRLSMLKDGQKLPAKNLSDTAIEWFEGKPDLQASEYACTDVETGNTCSSYVTVVPLMYVKAQDKVLERKTVDYETGFFHYFVQYNDDIEVFCSGPRPVTLISRLEDNKEMLANNIDATTVKVCIRNYTDGVAVISCIDSENSDYVSTVQIIPVLNMVGMVADSKRFHSVGYTGKLAVQYGEPLVIVCSGFDADHITVSENGVTTETNLYTLNRTAIKWIVEKPEVRLDGEDSVFSCSTGRYYWEFSIAVVPLIEAVGFHCVAHYDEYLNCSWTVLNNNNKYNNRFNLFYLEEGNTVHTWTKINVYTPTLSWTWHDTDFPSYTSFKLTTLSIEILSCNFIGCANQTFLVHHCSTFKPRPPNDLKVVSTSAYGAVILWLREHYRCPYMTHNSFGEMDYKLEYWYSGIQPRAVNLSEEVIISSHFELKLPCPEVFYQVWLYQKLNGTVGEDYWSEPSSISFFTAAGNSTDVVDPACDQKPKKTKEVMTYFVQELEQKVRFAGRQIKAKGLLLREKLAKIQALRDKLTDSN